MKDEQQSVKSFLDFVYNVYSQMQEREITLVYEGEITHQITKVYVARGDGDGERGRGEHGAAQGLSCDGGVFAEREQARGYAGVGRL